MPKPHAIRAIPLLLPAALAACGDAPEDAPPNTVAPATASPSPPIVSQLPSPTPSATAAPPARVSRYTSLQSCQTIELVPEEGYSRVACPGLADYRLEVVDGDAREEMMLLRNGKQHRLGLVAASSGGFSKLGDRIEWRGREENGAFRPDAIVLRYAVVEDPNEPTRPTSYLVPVSLLPTPCISDRIPPGPGQNERARAIADGPRRCL
ncbi:hypothetical protein LK533_11265 [Sphingomonas sp. PL-96]|uniref:hypothetical protein n=1 Tax=Sphingomonas sp. PL-96 TaxID=2887201 RepID=UPI001E39D55A|nr:hypothetical protein [Sphingomonas sp. PL-96]MCC2977249.1 hypothetical protein [Sphingomonas sp. PL-96]